MEVVQKENGNLVEITINYEGDDVTAVVTLEEANILLNDEAAASRYVQSLLGQPAQETVTTNNTLDESKENNALSSRKATLKFLELRIKCSDKFNDRKTLKQSLWQKIAAELKDTGFEINEGREGAEKCRQKFANLQRTYLNYIKHINTTGAEKRDPPPYFDEMHAILGEKDKVNPPYLEDSLEPSTSKATLQSRETGSSSIQKEIKNRFASHKTSVRPTSNMNKIFNLLKEQHDQIRSDKAQHMKIFENALNVQNEQRAEFLKILKHKRRRSNSSSSE